jgi:hypothetical protein
MMTLELSLAGILKHDLSVSDASWISYEQSIMLFVHSFRKGTQITIQHGVKFAEL